MNGAIVAVLFLGAYLVVSPDPVSLAVTRGSTGAARTAAGRRRNTRSTARGGGTRRRGTSFGQAVRQAWGDARAAAGAARARREAGRDTFSQIKRAGRAGFAGLGAVHQASGRDADRVRAGVRVAMEHWRRHAPGSTAAGSTADGLPDASGTSTPRLVDAAPGSDWASATDPTSTPPPPDDASPDASSTDPTGPTDTTDTTGSGDITGGKPLDKEGNNTMDMTELESLEAVHREARDALEMCGSLSEVVAEFKDWATGLADRWSGTAWGTTDLDAAVAGVGDAAATLVGGEGLGEALVAVKDAVKRAEALGEVATEIGAHGHVDAFRAA